MTKGDARRAFRAQQALHDEPGLRAAWALLEHQVAFFCFETLRLPTGSVVTLFGGLSDEVDLVAGAMERLRSVGLRTALFGLSDKKSGNRMTGDMEAFLVDNARQVRRGRFGVWEPDVETTQVLKPEELSVILLPGLFFTLEGARLGRGGGFFDRYLARTTAATLRAGVALDWQLVESLPLEPHDQQMDWLITEKRVIQCRWDQSPARPEAGVRVRNRL